MTQQQDSSTPTPPTGRRERNRLTTKLTIEDVATRLFLERGADEVTIEEICDGAGISRRSFFNYFESKGQLIGGQSETVMTEELLNTIAELPPSEERAFRLRLVELIGREYIAVYRRLHNNSIDPELSRNIARRRARLLRSSPELVYGRLRSMDLVKQRLKDAITANLKRHPANRALEGFPLEQEAILLVNLVTSTVWAAVALISHSGSGVVDAETFDAAGHALGTLHEGFDQLSFG